MKQIAMQFRWTVPQGGYRWIRTKELQGEDEEAAFLTDGRPVGGSGFAVKQYRPLKDQTGLFREFAETDLEDDTVLSFANRFGCLGKPLQRTIFLPQGDPPEGLPVGAGETKQGWFDEIFNMRLAVQLWDLARAGDAEGLRKFVIWDEDGRRVTFRHNFEHRGRRRGIGDTIAADFFAAHLLDRFEVGDLIKPAFYQVQTMVNKALRGAVSPRLLWSEDRSRLELHHYPESLRGALWFQFASAVANDTNFRRCRVCNTWFELSPRIARSDKVYCSNSCRTRAFRKARAEDRGPNRQGGSG